MLGCAWKEPHRIDDISVYNAFGQSFVVVDAMAMYSELGGHLELEEGGALPDYYLEDQLSKFLNAAGSYPLIGCITNLMMDSEPTFVSSPMHRSLFSLAFIVSGAIIYAFRTLVGPFTIRIVVPDGVNIVTQHALPDASSTRLRTIEHPELVPASILELVSISSSQKNIMKSIASFSAYEDYANQVIDRKYSRYAHLHPLQKQLVDGIGYGTQFTKAREEIQASSVLTRRVAQHGKEVYGLEVHDTSKERKDFQLITEMLGHIVRDWSELGSTERSLIFPPILDMLASHFENVDTKGEKKIIVPGFGLGCLAHEIAEVEGFSVTANDIDYTAILAYNFLLNHTSHIFEHTFYPFLRFPDYIPSTRSKANVGLVEGDFLKEFSDANSFGQYDAVVTLFFIDDGENITDFLERIYS
ncbi:N2227-like protein-domain-containing protein [Cyathus striatus]|nr:N2227-like protein-domain-containing protein [Cyathus striatus]